MRFRSVGCRGDGQAGLASPFVADAATRGAIAVRTGCRVVCTRSVHEARVGCHASARQATFSTWFFGVEINAAHAPNRTKGVRQCLAVTRSAVVVDERIIKISLRHAASGPSVRCPHVPRRKAGALRALGRTERWFPPSLGICEAIRTVLYGVRLRAEEGSVIGST